MMNYPINREPLIWASTGGPFEFRVSVELSGRPSKSDYGLSRRHELELQARVQAAYAEEFRFMALMDLNLPEEPH